MCWPENPNCGPHNENCWPGCPYISEGPLLHRTKTDEMRAKKTGVDLVLDDLIRFNLDVNRSSLEQILADFDGWSRGH